MSSKLTRNFLKFSSTFPNISFPPISTPLNCWQCAIWWMDLLDKCDANRSLLVAADRLIRLTFWKIIPNTRHVWIPYSLLHAGSSSTSTPTTAEHFQGNSFIERYMFTEWRNMNLTRLFRVVINTLQSKSNALSVSWFWTSMSTTRLFCSTAFFSNTWRSFSLSITILFCMSL